MTRKNRRVGDCGICGRIRLGLVANFNQPVTGGTVIWRIARHRNPDGGWCTPSVPEKVYEATPARAPR